MLVTPITKCPICNSDQPEVVFSPDKRARERFLELSRKKYNGVMDSWTDQLSLRVFKCPSCSHFWHAEFPDFSSLIAMYNSSKTLDETKRLKVPNGRMNREMSLLRRLVREGSNRPSFLDFGSGFGLWARAAHAAGFDVTAYEPSIDRANTSARIDGVRFVADLSDVGDQKFDVINVEQVLEHLIDPVSEVRQLKVKTSPNGCLVRLTVPNCKILLNDPEVMSKFPYDGTTVHIISPFEHLHGFTPRSFAKLLEVTKIKRLHRLALASPSQWLRFFVSGTFVIGTFDSQN